MNVAEVVGLAVSPGVVASINRSVTFPVDAAGTLFAGLSPVSDVEDAVEDAVGMAASPPPPERVATLWWLR